MKDFFINRIAKVISKYFVGNKTNYLGYIGLIIGAYNLIVELDIIKELCIRFDWCFEGSTIWGAITTVMSYLILLFRKATEIKQEEEMTEMRVSLMNKGKG
jgi:hypothetical protein